MEQPRDLERLARRAIGIAALALFVAGLLVAADLEELVVLTAALSVLCAGAGGGTWLLARHRRQLLRGVADGYAAAAPVLVRGARATARTVGRACAETARALRLLARRTGPALRRADVELEGVVRPLAVRGHRRASKLLATVVADIHAYRGSTGAAPARPQRPSRRVTARDATRRRAPQPVRERPKR